MSQTTETRTVRIKVDGKLCDQSCRFLDMEWGGICRLYEKEPDLEADPETGYLKLRCKSCLRGDAA